MSIDKNKILSNDNLLGLRGGGEDYIMCCVYDEDDVEQYRGPSGTGSCEGAVIPPDWSSRECDND